MHFVQTCKVTLVQLLLLLNGLLLCSTSSYAQSQVCQLELDQSLDSAFLADQDGAPLEVFAYGIQALGLLTTATCKYKQHYEEGIIDSLLILFDKASASSSTAIQKYFLPHLEKLYKKAIELYVDRYHSTGNIGYIDKFLRISEKDKAYSFKLGAFIGNSEQRALYESKRNHFRQQKQELLAHETFQTDKIRLIDDSINWYTDQLHQVSPIDKILASQADINVKALQQQLSKEEALIVYYPIDDLRYFSAVILIDTINLFEHQSAVPFSQLAQQFHRYKRTQFDSLVQVTQLSYEALIAPFSSLIKDRRRLYLVKAGIVNQLPLGALIKKLPTDIEGRYDLLPYLISDHSFIYLNSLYQFKTLAPEKKISSALVLAPVFDAEMKNHFAQIQADDIFDQIPTIKNSTSFVHQLQKKYKLDVLERFEANINSFKQQASEYELIHLDTHTFLNRRNSFNQAQIAFSKAVANDSIVQEGFLSINDIYSLGFAPPVLILGSCNTGLGMEEIGEGIVSIAYNFQLLGTQHVIYSNWSIEETATHQILLQFYDQLSAGQPIDYALQEAKIAYLKSCEGWKGAQNAAPYYWAGLVSNGIPLQVEIPKNQLFIRSNAFFLLIFLLAVLLILFYLNKKKSFAR